MHYSNYFSYLFALTLYAPLLLYPSTILAEKITDPLCSTLPYQAKPELGKSGDQQIHIQSDKVSLTKDNISLFSGNVEITRTNQQLFADQLEYQRDKNYLRAEGHVEVYTPHLKMTGSKAEFTVDDNQGVILDAEFATTQRGRGAAKEIDIQSENIVVLKNARFTTCDPGKPDWQLSSDEIKLDNNKQQGYAEDVKMKFKGVPIFYFPYLRFPIGDERMSGFLFPSFASSDQHGTELLLPYYWNIKPDLDATITPWIMSKRGVMLKNEIRYLNQNNSGQLEVDYLDKDEVFNDEDRTRVRWQHIADSSNGWSTFVDYNYVSDDQYLIDFFTDHEHTSTTHLNRKGSATYNSEHWYFYGNVQTHQTLSGAIPYRRLPQLKLGTREYDDNKQFNIHVESELVRFDHPENQVIGDRLDIMAAISYPVRTAATHFIPKLRLRHTQYQLEQTAVGEEKNPQRDIPLFSIDSGIVFERETRFFDNAVTQTLEPQLYYVYAPYRDQTALPVFDTSLDDFNVYNPFVEDRFSGTDRVGDADQLTASLATRFYHNDSGEELLSARIGQVFYFADREVTLPGGSVETRSKSNIIAEVIARPTSTWYLGSDAEWDIEQDKIANGHAHIRYTPDNDLDIQGTYRYERDILETAEVGFRWRLNPRWQLSARRVEDLLADRNQEDKIALRYDSCCWGLTLQLEDRYLTDTLERDQRIYLRLELKGLSNVGESEPFH